MCLCTDVLKGKMLNCALTKKYTIKYDVHLKEESNKTNIRGSKKIGADVQREKIKVTIDATIIHLIVCLT